MPEYYDEIGFDNEDVGGDGVEKYKGRKDYTDRIGFVFPKRVKKTMTHYKDRYIMCHGGLCCEKLGPPSYRLGTVLIHYGTDKKGNLEKPFRYTIKTWAFSGKKYEDLRNLNSEWSLERYDIKVTCAEEGYQQLKYVPCSESLWQKDARLKAQIEKEAENALKNIYLAADLSNEELRELLGVESAGPAESFDPSDDTEFDTMLQGMDLNS